MNNSWWQTQRKIATLPNVILNPDVVLARSLEKANSLVTNADGSKQPSVKGVYVGIHFWDDAFVYDYSNMQLRDLLMHKMVLDRRIAEVAAEAESVV